MQQLAIGWLAIQLAIEDQRPDQAALYVGLVGLARFAPGLVFGLVGGLMADRTEKRGLLLAMRTLSAVGCVGLASLVTTERAHIVSLMAFTSVLTIAFTIDLPVRIALTPALVRAGDLFSAFSLIRTTSQASLLIGPLIGGLLIVPFGVAGALIACGVMYAASALVLLGIPIVPAERSGAPSSALRSLGEGFRYIRETPLIRVLTLYAVAYAILGQSYIQFLPAVAHESLGVGALELSWLTSAAGLGALVGTFAVTLLGGFTRMGQLTLGNALAMAGLLSVFALQSSLVPALIAMVALSVANVTFFGLWSNVTQSHLPDRIRGRVNGIHVSVFHAGMPLGTLLLGAAGTLVGVANALLAAALALIVLTLLATGIRTLREARLGPRFRESSD